MVYAMCSIGILGFVVWSQWLAFPVREDRVINCAIWYWNSLVSISTFNSENLIGYAQPAGNLRTLLANLDDLAFALSLSPVLFYSNADTQKHLILSENKEKNGIYLWTNLINGQIYVGSSKNLRKRFWQYYNINYLADNPGMIICRALPKNGYSNFSLSILEYCSVKDLTAREKHYFDLLKPEYNVCKEPGKPNNTLGFKHTLETLEKISKSRLNNPQKTCKKLEVTDVQTGVKTTYNSVNLAGLALNIGHSSIIYSLTSKKLKPYKGRYIFKLIE